MSSSKQRAAPLRIFCCSLLTMTIWIASALDGVGCSQKLLFVTYSTVSVIFSLRERAGPATNHIKYANAGAVSLLLCLYKGTMMWFIHIHVRQNNIFWMDTSVSTLQRLYMVLQRVCAAPIPRPVARNTAVEPSYGGALAP